MRRRSIQEGYEEKAKGKRRVYKERAKDIPKFIYNRRLEMRVKSFERKIETTEMAEQFQKDKLALNRKKS